MLRTQRRVYQSSEDGITVSDISTNSDSGLKHQSSPHTWSSDENTTPTPTNKPRRKPRKFTWKFSKKIKSNKPAPKVPPRQPICPIDSTIDSSSMTSLSQCTQHCEYIEIFLPIAQYGCLGIMVVGQTTQNGESLGIYCGGIQPNSAAYAVKDFIEPGDRIISVDSLDITKLNNDQAVEVLQERVNICLKRIHGKIGFKIGINKFGDKDLVEEEDYEEIDDKRVGTQPINPAEWVKNHTSFYEGRSYSSESSSSMLSSNDCDATFISQKMYEISLENKPGLSNQRFELPPLSIQTSMRTMIRIVSDKRSGLPIHDRTWFRQVIPNAFLGADLVDWLHDHVTGLEDRRDAKQYACTLLKGQLIKLTIQARVGKFSEKSYYKF